MNQPNTDQAKLDEIRRKAALAKVEPVAPPRRQSRDPVKEPLISKVLYVLAIASFIIALILFKRDWTSDASSTLFLMLGFIQGIFFISIGLALSYLKGIYENTRDR
jgi:hypothetical protein